MKLLSTCIAMLMAVVLLSCNTSTKKELRSLDRTSSEPATANQQDGHNKTEAPLSVTNNSSSADTATANVLQAGQPATNPDWDKKIIKNANVTIELKDYNSYNTALHSNVRRYAAYISGEQQNSSDAKVENVITIKVPVDKFEDLMNALPADGVKILEKRISTEDVSDQVVDTKARIQAKKQVRERYLGFLKQAKNMKEILEVESEVNNVQQEIESGSGRVNFLTHQSAYSTINLTYFQYLNANTNAPVDSSPSFLTKLKEAFANGSSILSGLLLILLTFWPILLAGLVTWLLVKNKWAGGKTVVKTKL
jgi:hypothetical protein